MPPETPPAPVPDPGVELQRRMLLAGARAAHWRRTRRLTGVLLALWLATTFGTVFFARDLARLTVFGWPLSFYMAAQGSALAYLALIGAYAWRMRRLDRAFAAALAEGA